MITASLVLYKSKPSEVHRVLKCVEDSTINIVYVIDNSPTDELRTIVKIGFTKAIYIYGQGNIGFGAGNNIGIKESIKLNSEYHIILNPDIVFEPRVISGLYSFMDIHKEIGLIKPALTHIDGSFNASAFMLPTPMTYFCKRLFPKSISKKLANKRQLRDLDLNLVREVPNMSGSFMFIRVDVLRVVGMFDDRYFMYFEDFDLVRRIHKVSKVVYYPHETMIHAHTAEHRRNLKLFMKGVLSAIKYFNKWGWFIDADRRRWNKEVRLEESIIE